jgi:hypothetical protein
VHAHRQPGRHDVERLIQQVRSLEARSGRPAISVQVEAPDHTELQPLREALRESLGPDIDIDVITVSSRNSCRVVTVDFEWLP